MIVAILLDLCKSFDSADHRCILCKLYVYSISDILKLIEVIAAMK